MRFKILPGCLVVFTALFASSTLDCFAQQKTTVQKTKKSTQKTTSKNSVFSKKVISGGVLNGKALKLVKPEYSPAARKVGAHGTVQIDVLIDENGDVIDAKYLNGHPMLVLIL